MARIDGKAVFIPFTLPDEEIEFTIVREKKDFAFGRLTQVIRPSAHRVAPPCPLFGSCGGCSLQMADAAYQSELRLAILADSLRRSGVKSLQPPVIETGPSLEYRSRFQFHRLAGGKVGFMAGGEHTIIPVNDCPVAVPLLREALRSGRIQKMAGKAGDRFQVFSDNFSIFSETGQTDCAINIAGTPLCFDVRGFFQSNIPMLERLIGLLGADLPQSAVGGRLLDFYAGVGTFSACLGKYFSESVLVEHNSKALEKASLNVRDCPVQTCACTDAEWPQREQSRLDYRLAIVDPPRQGLAPLALKWFIDSDIADLRYVSCDPVTFARDAAALCAGGFTLQRVIACDFYPQTHHLETLGFFTR